MKHIKKKFSYHSVVSDTEFNALKESGEYIPVDSTSYKKPPEGWGVLLHLVDNTVIKAYYHKENGRSYYLPEPDPILVFYDNAYHTYKRIQDKKKKLLSAYTFNNEESVIGHTEIQVVYEHFGATSSFIINLFTSIEAYINKLIPDDYKHISKDKKSTSIYNKEQIERYLSFDKKYTDILKDIYGKSYKDKYQIKHQHITNLKNLRDDIIHLKANNDGQTHYDYIIKRLLKFKYKETLEATRDFFNFYTPSYIEDCPCNEDF